MFKHSNTHIFNLNIMSKINTNLKRANTPACCRHRLLATLFVGRNARFRHYRKPEALRDTRDICRIYGRAYGGHLNKMEII